MVYVFLNHNGKRGFKKTAFSNISGNDKRFPKRWWDLWCRENGSLLLKWQGCWASVGLLRENNTYNCSVWLPLSIVDCRLRRLAVPWAQKWSRHLFHKSGDRGCDPKRFLEMDRILTWSMDQRLFVRGDEARLLRACSCHSLLLVWFDCKYSIVV